MNRLEILEEIYGDCMWTEIKLDKAIRLIELVQKLEREECAKVCERTANKLIYPSTGNAIALSCAHDIRSRSTK